MDHVVDPVWAIRFARWTSVFLTEPRTDVFLYWMGESFMHEGEADPGSIIEPAAVVQKQVAIQQAGEFRRIGLGMLDGLAVFWQRLSFAQPLSAADAQVLNEAAEDPHNWFVVKDGAAHYVLRCCKLPFGSHVQQSMKAGSDGKTRGKKERVPQQAEARPGNTDCDRFSVWMDNILRHFVVLENAKNAEELTAQMAMMRPLVTDLGVLHLLRGRRAVMIMDGTSHHKKENPEYVPLQGALGLYGRGQKGRHERCIGWGKVKCILWLCFGCYAEEKASREDVKARLNEVVPNLFEALERSDVLDLRKEVERVSDRHCFMVKKKASEAHCMLAFTPGYLGKILNPTEFLWSSAMRAYSGSHKESKGNGTAAVAAMTTILKAFRQKEHCLIKMCLPWFRFSFAVLSAFYHRSVVEYEGQHVLPPVLQQAILNYADHVRPSIEHLGAGVDEQDFIGRAPEGLSKLKFPVTALHRDHSLRRFRLIQLDAQSIIEWPDVFAAPPANAEFIGSLIADVYECEGSGDAGAILDTQVDASATAGPVEEKSLLEAVQSRRAEHRKRPPSPLKAEGDRQRLLIIRALLGRSLIRCTCGNKHFHQELCSMWSNQHPRRLEQPGSDVGVSAGDWQFYIRTMEAQAVKASPDCP